MASGAAISDTLAQYTYYPLAVYNYANVQGRDYSSYASISSGSYIVADDLNLGPTSGEIDLLGPTGVSNAALTITKGAGKESVTNSGKTASLTFHQTETIKAGNAEAPETFAFASGFGTETIIGFATSGANADTLQLSAADFHLSSGMTQVQDLAALLGQQGGANTTLADFAGDSLTLVGVTASTLMANPGLVRFV